MRTYWHTWPRTCLWEWGWISHEQSWLGTQIKISSLNLGIGRWKIWLIRAVDHDGEEEAWTCSFGNIPNIRQAMEAHCRPWERRGWLRYLEIWFEVSLVISRHCLKTTKRKIQRLLFQNTLCSQNFFLVIQAFCSIKRGIPDSLWSYLRSIDGQKALLRKLAEWQWPASEPRVWLFFFSGLYVEKAQFDEEGRIPHD